MNLFEAITSSIVFSGFRASGVAVVGFSMLIERLKISINTYGSFMSSCWVYSNISDEMQSLSSIILDDC